MKAIERPPRITPGQRRLVVVVILDEGQGVREDIQQVAKRGTRAGALQSGEIRKFFAENNPVGGEDARRNAKGDYGADGDQRA